MNASFVAKGECYTSLSLVDNNYHLYIGDDGDNSVSVFFTPEMVEKVRFLFNIKDDLTKDGESLTIGRGSEVYDVEHQRSS